MTDKQTGGPAFPLMYDVPSENLRHIHVGMTLRDYFAAKAMQGFIAGDAMLKESDTSEGWLKNIADASYEMADAMLKAREA
jgi:hypothetical protein